MYVCICNNINEAKVREAVQDGARTVRDLKTMLSVGSKCGRCICTAKELLEEEKSKLAPPRSIFPTEILEIKRQLPLAS